VTPPEGGALVDLAISENTWRGLASYSDDGICRRRQSRRLTALPGLALADCRYDDRAGRDIVEATMKGRTQDGRENDQGPSAGDETKTNRSEDERWDAVGRESYDRLPRT
jgi:hypothetical protein